MFLDKFIAERIVRRVAYRMYKKAVPYHATTWAGHRF